MGRIAQIAQLCKSWTVLAILGQCSKGSPIPTMLAEDLTPEIFLVFLEAGDPLIIRGGMLGWRARTEWSVEWFQKSFPHDEVTLRNQAAYLSFTQEQRGLADKMTLTNFSKVTVCISVYLKIETYPKARSLAGTLGNRSI